MAAKPHARYQNPYMGVIHWCPTRQSYIKASEHKSDLCLCGKRIKQDNRGK